MLACMHVYVCACVHLHIHVRMHVWYVCVFMCVCVHVHICMVCSVYSCGDRRSMSGSFLSHYQICTLKIGSLPEPVVH